MTQEKKMKVYDHAAKDLDGDPFQKWPTKRTWFVKLGEWDPRLGFEEMKSPSPPLERILDAAARCPDSGPRSRSPSPPSAWMPHGSTEGCGPRIPFTKLTLGGDQNHLVESQNCPSLGLPESFVELFSFKPSTLLLRLCFTQQRRLGVDFNVKISPVTSSKGKSGSLVACLNLRPCVSNGGLYPLFFAIKQARSRRFGKSYDQKHGGEREMFRVINPSLTLGNPPVRSPYE